MTVDFLIVGQGISGSLLSRELKKAGCSVLVIDNGNANASSRVAGGMINPITGRRLSKSWMIDELMPFAMETYGAIERELDQEFVSRKDIVDFFPNPDAKLVFNTRREQEPQYLSLPRDENQFREQFGYDFGFGLVQGSAVVFLHKLLPVIRSSLIQHAQLLEEQFDLTRLEIRSESIRYKDIDASKIIFCDGINSFENDYFKGLPFSYNKGQAIWIESKDLEDQYIFKKSIQLVPQGDQVFWVGSSYEWNFSETGPTNEFRERVESVLKQWLKCNFKIIDHRAALRPATLERRPFVGLHPKYPQIGMLNGMGTKGCSLAPFFSKQLTEYMLNGAPIVPEAGLSRFTRILNRSS